MLACDDGRVDKLGGGRTVLACIHWERPYGLDDAIASTVTIDGLDATSIASYMLRVLSLRWDPDAVIIDSIATAGFNLLSPPGLYEASGVPVIVVYTYRPRLDRIMRALEKSGLPYLSVRRRVLELAGKVERVETSMGTVYVLVWGESLEYARRIIEYSQVYDRKPTPVRFAHYIASALSGLLTSNYSTV